MAKDPSTPWDRARPKADAESSPKSRPRRGPAAKSEAARPGSGKPRPGKGKPAKDRPVKARAESAPSARPGRGKKAETGREAPRPPVSQFPDADTEATSVRGDRHDEYKIHGVNACLAAFQRRREDIIRAYFSHGIAGKFGETMRYLAQQKKAYRVVDDEELERITQSSHHGGVCFLMKKRKPLSLRELLDRLPQQQSVCLVVLEGVGNPHNLGAIMRSCAHFDVPAILVENANLLQSGAAARVAEGGAEWVELVEYDNLERLFEQLHAAGFSLLSTSSHQGRDLYRTELPQRTALFLGEESHGLKPSTLQSSDLCIRIPGTSRIESLNVNTAASIILGEFWRQHKSALPGVRPMAPASAQPKGGRLKLAKGKPRGSA